MGSSWLIVRQPITLFRNDRPACCETKQTYTVVLSNCVKELGNLRFLGTMY